MNLPDSIDVLKTTTVDDILGFVPLEVADYREHVLEVVKALTSLQADLEGMQDDSTERFGPFEDVETSPEGVYVAWGNMEWHLDRLRGANLGEPTAVPEAQEPEAEGPGPSLRKIRLRQKT